MRAGAAWGTGVPQVLAPARRVWRRELRQPGNVLVAPGERVAADTDVASGTVPTMPSLVSLEGLPPLVAPGARIAAGDVVAQHRRLLRPPMERLTPVAGTVRAVVAGSLVVQPEPRRAALKAQLPGVIAAVHEGWGAEVEGVYGLLHGVSGTGAEVQGRLGEQIVVYPDPVSASTARAAASQGVQAVIAPAFLGGTPDMGLTFLLTERAQVPMAPPIAELLRAHEGMAAAIQFAGGPLLAFVSDRQPAPAAPARLGPGSWARLADGRTGRLVQLLGERYFESGVYLAAAEIDLGNSTEIAPLDGLEWVA